MVHCCSCAQWGLECKDLRAFHSSLESLHTSPGYQSLLQPCNKLAQHRDDRLGSALGSKIKAQSSVQIPSLLFPRFGPRHVLWAFDEGIKDNNICRRPGSWAWYRLQTVLQISEVIGQDFKNQILWNCPGRSKDTFTKDELGPPSIRFGDTSLQLTGISAGISCWEKEKSERPCQADRELFSQKDFTGS